LHLRAARSVQEVQLIKSCKALHLRAARSGRQVHFIWDGFEVFFFAFSADSESNVFPEHNFNAGFIALPTCIIIPNFVSASPVCLCAICFQRPFLEARKIVGSSTQDWFLKPTRLVRQDWFLQPTRWFLKPARLVPQAPPIFVTILNGRPDSCVSAGGFMQERDHYTRCLSFFLVMVLTSVMLYFIF
jgi:hypothetical protein